MLKHYPAHRPFDANSHMSFSNHNPNNEGSISMMSGHSANRMTDAPMMTPNRTLDDTMSAISSRAPPSRISSSTSSHSRRKQTNDFRNMQQQLNEMRQAKLKSDAEHREFVQMAQQQMTTMFETEFGMTSPYQSLLHQAGTKSSRI